MLRLISYLVPSPLYRRVADDLERQLGVPVALSFDHETSGPLPTKPNPFVEGRAEVGFICGESYLRELPGLDLLGVAPVYDDDRNGGEPIYFSELVVRRDAPYRSTEDLDGTHLVYNDPASLSGYSCLLDHLCQRGLSPDMFASITPSGGHETSLQLIAGFQADVAAIDAMVWRAASPGLRAQLRILDTLGPYPAQPAVVRTDLNRPMQIRIRQALLTMHERDGHGLRTCGVIRFSAVTEQTYRAVGPRLERARRLWPPSSEG